MSKTIIAIALCMPLLLASCNPPKKVYECEPGNERICQCENKQLGTQKCATFPDSWKARTWKPCTCCFNRIYDEHGLTRIEKLDGSGCWGETYDPSIPTYDEGSHNGEDRGSSQNTGQPPRSDSQND